MDCSINQPPFCYYSWDPTRGTGFYVGQIQIMLAWCITEFYLAMRGGREFLAGMWLDVRCSSPYHGLLLGLLFALETTLWSAVLGAGASGSIILGGFCVGQWCTRTTPILLHLAEWRNFEGMIRRS